VKVSVKKRHITFVGANDVNIFNSATNYKRQLLALITQAKNRIYITALYLQDDMAGREILHALYQAKQAKPQLEIKVFVDYHRAQRGLIGEKQHCGNRALYLSLTQKYQYAIEIYGVSVKRKELFGVLHLKGMVFDEQLFYTGASINDVYCQQDSRYRLDRYYQINSPALTDSFCQYLNDIFVFSALAARLDQPELPDHRQQKRNTIALKSRLKKSFYLIDQKATSQSIDNAEKISIQPLIGYGRRNNKLNGKIRRLVQCSQQSLLMFTPYFNLPPVLARDVIKALKRGVKVTIIVGDKTANDFFVADEKAFSTIGIVPYIYEMLLKRFVKRWQYFIECGLLNVRLWKDGDNSFHLKGLQIDHRYHLITGSNLNPRAWSLDLENGLLLDDPAGLMQFKTNTEVTEILKNTTKINHFTELDDVSDYPEKPQKLLKKIRMTQIDRILKRFL